MSWKNIKLIFMREVRDQLRDRRTLFMITVLPVLLYPMLGLGVVQMMLTFSEQQRVVVILNTEDLPEAPALLDENGIDPDWYDNGQEDASRLRILAERAGENHSANGSEALSMPSELLPAEEADSAAHAPGAESSSAETRPRRRGEKTDAELLVAAHSLAEQITTLQSLTDSSAAAADHSSDDVAREQKRLALQYLDQRTIRRKRVPRAGHCTERLRRQP